MKRRMASLAALFALACGSTSSDSTSPDLRPSPSGGGSLTGTAWVLTEIRGEPALGEVEITLVVDESTAGGNAGCNHYGGTPRITDGTFRLVDLAATLRACEDTRLMDQESDNLAILAQTSAWDIEGDRLELVTETGDTLAFRASDEDAQ